MTSYLDSPTVEEDAIIYVEYCRMRGLLPDFVGFLKQYNSRSLKDFYKTETYEIYFGNYLILK